MCPVYQGVLISGRPEYENTIHQLDMVHTCKIQYTHMYSILISCTYSHIHMYIHVCVYITCHYHGNILYTCANNTHFLRCYAILHNSTFHNIPPPTYIFGGVYRITHRHDIRACCSGGFYQIWSQINGPVHHVTNSYGYRVRSATVRSAT